MELKKSEVLYREIKRKGLYKVLQEEIFYNADLALTLEEQNKIKALIKQEIGKKDDLIEIDTINQLFEAYLEFVRMEVPEKILHYVDIVAMICDDIMSGLLNYANFRKGQKEFLVFWQEG